MASWKKKSYPSMARDGRKNGRWKDGSSQTHYRNKANAPKGKVVHHKDGNKSNNSKSNVRVISKAEHNKVHPERVEEGSVRAVLLGAREQKHA